MKRMCIPSKRRKILGGREKCTARDSAADGGRRRKGGGALGVENVGIAKKVRPWGVVNGVAGIDILTSEEVCSGPNVQRTDQIRGTIRQERVGGSTIANATSRRFT